MKTISILGSTGSIGRNTLEIARHLNIRVAAIAGNQNIDLLEKQATEFKPDLVAVYDEKNALELQKRLPFIPVVAGLEGLIAAACHGSVDLVVAAMVGTIGITPIAKAIACGKSIALANKEILVSAGSYIQNLAKKHQVALLPIDSEHSAIFQCIVGEDPEAISRIIITASGGPFLHYPKEDLQNITVEAALNHPSWKMGPKVTIDSSTLMNKGLEVIEAYWLFGVRLDQIQVVIHPQSVIHSMVEYCDGSIMAQMSDPDMKLPIQYALTYPKRKKGVFPPFDITKQRRLDFYPPDYSKFRCLSLAFDSLKAGKSYPCYLNAANEVLVSRFLEKKIGWSEIGEKLEKLLSLHAPKEILSLEEIFEVDTMARNEALTI